MIGNYMYLMKSTRITKVRSQVAFQAMDTGERILPTTSQKSLVGAVVSAGLVLLLAACQVPPPQLREPSTGHVRTTAPVAEDDIPSPVKRTPFVPIPEPAQPQETYTVVVNEVPVKELLFALSRDASVNVDVHPKVDGLVTLNAVDQTLEQILDRIAHQTELRYEERNGTIVISPDTPFLRTYRLDYVNMSRDSSSEVKTSTKVSTTGGAEGGDSGNTSDTTVTNTSNNRVWETVVNNLRLLVATEAVGDEESSTLETVIANPESGIIVVRATAKQHELVQAFLDEATANLHRQLLIEATIVEIELSDRYQSGVDWAGFANSTGIDLSQSVLGAFVGASGGAVTGLLLNAGTDLGTAEQDIQLTVRLLKEFGDTRVLSSPKVMGLNNQTAVLKVVDNEVYFSGSTRICVG